MDDNKITRYMLYIKSANMIKIHNNIIEYENPLEVKKMYHNSAILIKGFEDIIIHHDNLLDSNKFSLMFKKNLSLIDDKLFIKYIKRQFKNEMTRKKNNKKYKKILFKELFRYLILAISKYQDIIIDKNYKKIHIERLKNNINKQTFLSYAYDDKGLTQALFYYFYDNSGFLYVNWMWSGVNMNAAYTKQELEKALHDSEQLLFLRTPLSELQLRGSQIIRQWCAWEIGNFYTKHKDYKYYTEFYDITKSRNDFLDTFKPMKGVQNGKII